MAREILDESTRNYNSLARRLNIKFKATAEKAIKETFCAAFQRRFMVDLKKLDADPAWTQAQRVEIASAWMQELVKSVSKKSGAHRL